MRLRPAIGFALVLLFGCGGRTGLLGFGVEGSTASMAGSGAVGAGAGSGSTTATGSGSIFATGGGSTFATGGSSTSATGGGAATGTTPDSAADGGTDDASAPTCAAGPSAALPPSCASGGPGMTNCGACESCCTSLEVLGGAFYRTYDLDPNIGGANWIAPDGGATGLADLATISTFVLDKYDVTVGRFRQFVEAWNGGAGYTPPAGSGKHMHLNGGKGLLDVSSPGNGPVYEAGWNPSDSSGIAPTNANLACDPQYATWTTEAGSNESRPINCLTWIEAYAFCIWDGGFLPSDAEWEYAAAGGNQQRTYPWGSADPGTENQYAIYGCFYPSGPPGFNCGGGVSNIAHVGTVAAGAGRFGQLDLAGEMYQWSLDWSAEYGFTDAGMAPCSDCAYVTGTAGRVVRGGDFLEGASSLLSPFRNFLGVVTGGGRDFGVGVRCARSP